MSQFRYGPDVYKRAKLLTFRPKNFKLLNGALCPIFAVQSTEILGTQQNPTMFYDFRPLIPLSLDRVLSGKSINSSLPIFRLPIELVSHIVPYLSPLDIRRLAFVDRDSRQLARALQFAHVELDYSSRSLELLATLRNEVDEPHDKEHRLGICIRRLTVRNTWSDFSSKESLELDDFRRLSIREQYIEAETLTKATYLDNICSLLPHLPNLHILDWKDEEPLKPDMLGSIMSSSIRHLRLDGPLLDPSFTLTPPAGQNDWPIESLSINIGWLLTSSGPGDVTSFISSLMRLTAPTLRYLTWSGYAGQILWETPSCVDFRFPVLQEVTLDHPMLKEPTMLNTIIRKNTHIRSISVNSNPVVSQFLSCCGYIPSLDRLRWDQSHLESYDDLLEFVHNNTQLASLEVTSPLPSIIIKSIIINHGHQTFDHLTVLHLVLEGHDFSEDILTTISSITSLQRLWLSTGTQHGVRHDWTIDHEILAEALRPLSRLETLVLTRDTYAVDGHPLLDSSTERYYVNRALPRDLLLSDYLTKDELKKMDCPIIPIDEAIFLMSSLRCLAWERWHRSQMVAVAARYAETLTRLKWCFVGQLPIRVDDIKPRRAVRPMTEERDYLLRVLHVCWNADFRFY